MTGLASSDKAEALAILVVFRSRNPGRSLFLRAQRPVVASAHGICAAKPGEQKPPSAIFAAHHL
jgi:hypothetical protein